MFTVTLRNNSDSGAVMAAAVIVVVRTDITLRKLDQHYRSVKNKQKCNNNIFVFCHSFYTGLMLNSKMWRI